MSVLNCVVAYKKGTSVLHAHKYLLLNNKHLQTSPCAAELQNTTKIFVKCKNGRKLHQFSGYIIAIYSHYSQHSTPCCNYLCLSKFQVLYATISLKEIRFLSGKAITPHTSASTHRRVQTISCDSTQSRTLLILIYHY